MEERLLPSDSACLLKYMHVFTFTRVAWRPIQLPRYKYVTIGVLSIKLYMFAVDTSALCSYFPAQSNLTIRDASQQEMVSAMSYALLDARFYCSLVDDLLWVNLAIIASQHNKDS